MDVLHFQNGQVKGLSARNCLPQRWTCAPVGALVGLLTAGVFVFFYFWTPEHHAHHEHRNAPNQALRLKSAEAGPETAGILPVSEIIDVSSSTNITVVGLHPSGTSNFAKARRRVAADAKVAALEFSLFVSLAPPSEHFGLHYLEILAAIRGNVLSGVFREVIIWYEETASRTCPMLLRTLTRGFAPMERIMATEHGRLRCWRRVGGQPSYGEIFSAVLENAGLGRLQTEAVVIANSDVVFGLSLRTVLPIKPGDLHTLSVNGVARDMAEVYCATMGQPKCSVCHEQVTPKTQPRDCGIRQNGRRYRTITSWDAYAINVSSTLKLQVPVDKLGFTMNVNGAENRAVCELVRAGWKPFNHCHSVRAVHFHCTAKTHLLGASKIRAAKEWRKDPTPCAAGDFSLMRFFGHGTASNQTYTVPTWAVLS